MSPIQLRFGPNAEDAIYLDPDGSRTLLADQSTPIPDRQGNFSSFDDEVGISGNNVVFKGRESSFDFGGIYVAQVPEPSAALALVSALFAIGALRIRRR